MLATRDLIGQAKGILAERFTVDDDEAFQMLVSSSQDTNMKLVDVARWLAAKRVRHEPRPAHAASGASGEARQMSPPHDEDGSWLAP